mmetsp:Transcript_16625/g.64919  ORF Transcript_16625/g.64919 Transcript_16625/m.64919 type:complete len:172 (-) Transcript_16625:71-586(-)
MSALWAPDQVITLLRNDAVQFVPQLQRADQVLLAIAGRTGRPYESVVEQALGCKLTHPLDAPPLGRAERDEAYQRIYLSNQPMVQGISTSLNESADVGLPLPVPWRVPPRTAASSAAGGRRRRRRGGDTNEAARYQGSASASSTAGSSRSSSSNSRESATKESGWKKGFML